MFPEASEWRADIVRVTAEGRVPISADWDGYDWNDLMPDGGIRNPGVWHHADAGIESELAFLAAALDWVAAHTPRDGPTQYLEEPDTHSRNAHPEPTFVLRTRERN